MPIRPENVARYPRHWHVLAYCLKADRAAWHCEQCGAEQHEPHPTTGARVVLTVAHLDHTPENCHPANLAVWCQKCHNAYDAPTRRRNRRRRLELANGQRYLFADA